MKKRWAMSFGILLSGLLVTSALAAGNGKSPVDEDPRKGKGKSKGQVEMQTHVPQAQIELFKKREEAKERRDLLMKMRRQKIEAADQGMVEEQKTLPSPPK